MAIDVLIKQKLFGNKTMPLEIILGDNLHYGTYEQDRLNTGELGEGEFIAYNPQSIGRGFSVIWNPAENKNIALHLPVPSTIAELKDFYLCVERMVNYWGGKLIVDGNKTSLKDFMAGLDEMIAFNQRTLKDIASRVISGEHDTLTLYSAMWPLDMGKEEAETFLNSPEKYAEWLHEKQSAEVYFPSPDLYMGDNGVFGVYTLISGIPTVLPYKPTVPYSAVDPKTGKPLECKKWVVLLGIRGEKNPLCEMDYSALLQKLPKEKMSRFDGKHFLLAELTQEKTKNIAGI